MKAETTFCRRTSHSLTLRESTLVLDSLPLKTSLSWQKTLMASIDKCCFIAETVVKDRVINKLYFHCWSLHYLF